MAILTEFLALSLPPDLPCTQLAAAASHCRRSMLLKLVNLLSLLCILQNFDDVLTPIDHVSRNPNDTYYVDKDTVR